MTDNEHVFLVGLQIAGDTRAEAEKALMQHLPRPSGYPAPSPVECWWVAEDDRTDRSDNDSAIFVSPTATIVAANLLVAAGLTEPYNVPQPEHRNPLGQFNGTHEPRESSLTRYERAQAVIDFMNLAGIGAGDIDLLDALTWLNEQELMDEANLPAAFEALAGTKEYEWHGNQEPNWERLTEHTQDAVEEAGLLTFTEVVDYADADNKEED